MPASINRLNTAFRAAMEIIEPLLSEGQTGGLGKFIIGTVAGDMHDLGKMMVITMLRGAGFQVIDLGEDVPEEVFLNKVRELKPHILGLGCYMTTTMPELEKVIKKLEQHNYRNNVKVMIGGGQIDEAVKDYVGADAYGKDAMAAVSLAKQWIAEK